jgi:fermentation-respiration switch protein FrsA (DUF1100 family)
MTQIAQSAVSLAALIAAASGAAAAEPLRVSFQSQGDTLVGALYLPSDHRAGEPLNAIVVTGAWTTVKEQMPATYAAALAERGYAALAFDFRGWGESDGAPRQLENPTRKIEDIVAAAAFLRALPEIDTVGGLGICASAGYMVAAAVQSDAIQSVGLVAPWLHDAAIVDAVSGGPDAVASLIATGRDAAAHFAETGEDRMIPAASATDAAALMGDAPYYVDPERGAIEAYVNEFNLASWEGWLTFDALALAPQLTNPLLFVHSDAAAIPQGAHAFEAASDQSRGVWLDDVTQFDFYDQPEAVTQASDAVAAHFDATL